ncbi:bifunctional diguanylate cyclase/phosphodiesterase [Actinoplanes sp. NEAU-A12]|uniref:Bifunctional diguanylate cyclase/phosphodiesterase n=1 Tax=Actinoplanes sandaracinus TaxID=3045177 RepID=A0ABT6WNK7_9ACTN|nr:bifunctional diguanylate cyclase/phosphodiesterase [Actinoplanes sandaracinus]MDI6101325.1 bifunctional diguanylate cyclase/phosphodiesterase [Actinoplanes sandaracinus]
MAVDTTVDDPRAARRWARSSAAVGALLTILVALVVSGVGGPAVALAISSWGLLALAAGASAACLWRSRGFTGRARWGWSTLATGLLLWGLGQFSWLAERGVAGAPEGLFGVFSNPGLIGLIVLIPAGLLILPSASQPMANRLRSVLDGLLIASSLILVAWVFVMDPNLESGAHRSSFYLTLVFPLTDIVIATVVAYMLPAQRRRHGCGSDLAFFGAGMVAFAITDVGHVYFELIGDSGAAAVVHLAALAGYALILMGAIRPRQRSAAPLNLPPGVWNNAIMIPYVAVLAALASSVMFHVQTGHNDPFVTYTRSFLILLIVGRQVLTQLENRTLTRTLESRVAERTAELHTREQWFHALIRHSSDVVTVIDADGMIRYQSDSMRRVFGYEPEVFLGRRYTDLVDAEVAMRLSQAMRRVAARPYSTVTLEVVHTHRDGRKRPSEVIITNLVDDPHVAGFVLNTRDISERKELQEQLLHEAYHDPLTQLANRALFREQAATALREAGAVTVLHLDLDGFKRVNDSLGHLAGDQLLVQIADRLRGCVRDGDLVARFGADEFGVLLIGADEVEDSAAEQVARRILADLDAPVLAGTRQIHVRASIGLAGTRSLPDTADNAGDRAEQLMRNADLAMHHAKSGGGNVVAGYHARMREGLVERLELESDLRAAVENGDLRLHYQPLVDLASSQVIGFEALVRWPHPTRGMINPLDFIPIAEATGLIVPLGRWVLHEACRQAVEWSTAAGGRPLKMSVNVSVRQFDRADLSEVVAAVLAETGMPADRLCLEMTESVLMTDTDANLEQLVRLKALGLTLAIDDFGTGYSSLAYLRRFPVDTLKIDRSFVERLGVIADDTALTDTIVRLGKSLGMATVAEGIEEFGQLAALREMGCGFAQGYYFSRPVPAAEAGRLFLEGAAV